MLMLSCVLVGGWLARPRPAQKLSTPEPVSPVMMRVIPQLHLDGVPWPEAIERVAAMAGLELDLSALSKPSMDGLPKATMHLKNITLRQSLDGMLVTIGPWNLHARVEGNRLVVSLWAAQKLCARLYDVSDVMAHEPRLGCAHEAVGEWGLQIHSQMGCEEGDTQQFRIYPLHLQSVPVPEVAATASAVESDRLVVRSWRRRGRTMGRADDRDPDGGEPRPYPGDPGNSARQHSHLG